MLLQPCATQSLRQGTRFTELPYVFGVHIRSATVLLKNWRARKDSNPHSHLLSSVLETDVLPITLLTQLFGSERRARTSVPFVTGYT